MPAPPPPLPFPGTDAARAREHRATAGRLRAAADVIEAAVHHVVAYDRPDVWSGAVAERSRAARAETLGRLSSPTSGAVVGLREVAARLEALAAGLEPGPAPAPSPVPTPPWRRDAFSPPR